MTTTTATKTPSVRAPSTNWDRIFFVFFLLGISFLGVVVGLLLAAFDTRAFAWTEDAVAACRALSARQAMNDDQYLPWLWQPVEYETAAATTGPANGQFYCLYTSGGNADATLIDANGEIVHQWQAPFSKMIPVSDLSKSMVPDNQINLRRGHVYPNGDLLALYETPTNTPAGMGLCRLSADGTPIWSLDKNCHHDFALADDGTIFTLTHRLKTPDHPQSYFQGRLCLEDFVTIVSETGEVKNEFSLLQLYYNSPYYRPDILKRDHTGDLLHTNTINLIGPSFAKHHDGVEAGQLMVCFRNINLVAVVDPAQQKIVWATSGPWHFPHDPDPLDNGNLMIYDNCFDRGDFVGSRVVEFDPRSGNVVWQSVGPVDQPMRSDIRSTQQQLENGNILICDSNGGRMLEMSRDQKLIWQFINPASVQVAGTTLRPVMTAVVRYEPNALPFLQQSVDQIAKHQLNEEPR